MILGALKCHNGTFIGVRQRAGEVAQLTEFLVDKRKHHSLSPRTHVRSRVWQYVLITPALEKWGEIDP